MTRKLTEAEIAAATDQAFDPARTEVVHRPEDPKKVLSTRVPEAISSWIAGEAVARRVSPSLLTAELLGEAIAARRAAAGAPPRRMVDVDALHRAIDGLAAAG